MDFSSVLFIIVAMAYVIGGVAQCIRPLALKEYTPKSAKPFRIVSICSCFVAAIGCMFVAMGTNSTVLSIIGCVILVATLIVEIICTNKLMLKQDYPLDEPEEKVTKKAKDEQEYEPYEDEELEEIEDEMREDGEEADGENEEDEKPKKNKQID